MPTNSQQVLHAAAAQAMERIRLDHEKAPQRIKPLLAFIRDNLFDPKLDVNYLKRCCGVRDNTVPIYFHSATGRPPHGYIEDRRLETACALLEGTDLNIWKIGELLGYSSIQVFSRAFKRWSGERPTAYRKKQRRKASKKGQASSLYGDEQSYQPEYLRAALNGELKPEQASPLILRLLDLYPEVHPRVGLLKTSA